MYPGNKKKTAVFVRAWYYIGCVPVQHYILIPDYLITCMFFLLISCRKRYQYQCFVPSTHSINAVLVLSPEFF